MANTIQIGADTSGFVSGIARARTSMAGLGSVIQQVVGAAGIMGTLAGAAREFYKALDFGGQLADQSAQTGVAVDKLMELQFAFELAGMTANDVQPAIAKLQRSVAEAATGSAQAAQKFVLMGVGLDEITGLSADEQLMKVGNAINKIENPTQRAAMAMEIFGKSGGKLLTFFSDMGMEGVENALGKQSAIMLQNAGVFARTADAMNIAGVKVRGFFIGLASNTAPQLIELVDKLEKLDLTNVGQSLGDGIAITLELIDRTFGKFMAMSEKAAKTQSTYSSQAFMSMGGMGMGGAGIGLSTAEEKSGAEQPKTSIFANILEDIEKKREEVRKKYATPEPGDTGAGYIPKTPTGGIIGMPDISSLQRVGGGSALLSGGQDNSPAYQSVRIQEDIRTYIKQLIDVVKQGGQDYQIAPAQSGNMLLTA
jgi:hypothetical protein